APPAREGLARGNLALPHAIARIRFLGLRRRAARGALRLGALLAPDLPELALGGRLIVAQRRRRTAFVAAAGTIGSMTSARARAGAGGRARSRNRAPVPIALAEARALAIRRTAPIPRAAVAAAE